MIPKKKIEYASRYLVVVFIRFLFIYLFIIKDFFVETFFLGKKNRQKKRLFSFPNTLWSNNEPAATDPCDIGAQKAPSRIERRGRREHQLLSSCDDPKVEEERVALGRGGVRASRSSFDASTRMPCASPTRIRRQLSLVLLVVDSRLRVADFTARRRERFGETEKHVQVFRRRKRKRARDDRGSGAREDAKRWNDDGHAGTFLVRVFPYFSLALSRVVHRNEERIPEEEQNDDDDDDDDENSASACGCACMARAKSAFPDKKFSLTSSIEK